jgi:O-succinylbenzoic acid--CoA ligase
VVLLSRPLVALPGGPAAAPDLLRAVDAALSGAGPAVLPLPAEPGEARRVAAALGGPEATVVEGVAAVVATSGSTGRPKGVLLGAAALAASARATHERLGGPGRWLLALPVHHVAGLQVLVRSVLAGTTPVVLPAGTFTAAGFRSAAAALGGGRRYTALVPTQLTRLLDDGGDGLPAARDFDAILLGGAAAPPALLRRAAAAGLRVVTTYGMTETCGGCVYDGRPLDGVRVRLAAEGRIEIAGATLAAGYHRDPSATATAFRGGWFHTGDLGSWTTDGRLSVLGRADDVIVTGGEKVPPGAVEAALAEDPAVADVAVVGVPDREWGERVVAVVVPAAGRGPDLPALRSRVAAAALPLHYAPRGMVSVPALPRRGPGKPDRAELRRLAAAG